MRINEKKGTAMTTAVITCDHPAFQEIEKQIRSAIDRIKGIKKTTRHDRARWHQLLAHAEKMVANFSKRAKESIEGMLEEFKKLLKGLCESRRQPRNTRSRSRVAR